MARELHGKSVACEWKSSQSMWITIANKLKRCHWEWSFRVIPPQKRYAGKIRKWGASLSLHMKTESFQPLDDRGKSRRIITLDFILVI